MKTNHIQLRSLKQQLIYLSGILLITTHCQQKENNCQSAQLPAVFMEYDLKEEAPFCLRLVIQAHKEGIWLYSDKRLSTSATQLIHEGNNRTPVYLSDSISVKNALIFRYQFKPVNNLELYRKIEFEGDIKQEYALQLSDQEQPLHFSLPEQQYKTYLREKGNEQHLSLYTWTESEKFINNSKSYLEQAIPLEALPGKQNQHQIKAHSVRLQDHELMIDGTMIRLSAFADKDYYFLDMKMVHHGLFPMLKLQPEKIRLQLADGTELSPQNPEGIFEQGRKEAESNSLVIGKGARLRYLFRYPKNGMASENLKVSLKGLLVNQTPLLNEMPIFQLERADSNPN